MYAFFLIDELKRPGVLLALLANIDASLRGSTGNRNVLRQSALQVVCTNRSAVCRRISTTLRQLTIFPLTDGRVVSLSFMEGQLLLPPPPPVGNSANEKDIYCKYWSTLIFFVSQSIEYALIVDFLLLAAALVELSSRLGHVVLPFALYPSLDPVDIPRLLTDSVVDNGLGLRIGFATEIFHASIIPHLETASNIENDWCLAAAQLAVWCRWAKIDKPTVQITPSSSSLTSVDELISSVATKLPILMTDGSRLLPLASIEGNFRETPALVPPCLLHNIGDELQFELITNCSEVAVVPTYNYFSGPDKLEFSSPPLRKYWLQLFMEAGMLFVGSLFAVLWQEGSNE